MAELKKVLNYPMLLLIIINSIMGTGIFFLPAIGFSIGGPASIISWVVMSLFSIYISMCFAELCGMFPSAGGIYEFSKHAYGRFLSFIIGWLTLIVGNITIAMLIIGAISYLLPANIPGLQIVIMLISVSFLVIFNTVAYRGMKTSATMLVTFAFVTLLTLFALIIPSFFNFNTSYFVPFFSKGNAAVFLAIFFIAETFFGWESSTFLAGETKDGARVVPKAMVRGTVIICLIAVVFVITAIGTVGGPLAESLAPLSDIANVVYGSGATSIFMILAYLSIIGSVAGWVISAPRLILSMAEDKLFLYHFRKIHPKYSTPGRAIVLQCILSIIFVFIGLGSYETLLHMLVPLLLITYAMILFSVVVLRFKKPHIKRHYVVPFGKVGPIIVVVFLMGLLVSWLMLTHDASSVLIKGLSMIALGIPVYFLLEMYYDPKMVRLINDISAEFSLLTERINLPTHIRREIIHLLGDIKGRTILEFGCSVGTLTMHLAEEVGPHGKVYATDISKRVLTIADRRLKRKGHKHVKTIHDIKHHSRVHPSVPKIHTAVSVGALGYLKDPLNTLKDINKRLKLGSKVCFVDYDKFFDIIPAVEWLEDDKKIKNIFNKAGFKISVVRKQGFAWKYIYIYGKKTKNL